MTTKAPTAHRSGFCLLADRTLHGLCNGRPGGYECPCECHKTCPTCGQPKPSEGVKG